MRSKHCLQRLHVIYLVFASLLVGSSRAETATTPAEVEAALKGKPLFLRGCWKGNTLHFNEAGKPLDTPSRLPFSLCGIDVREVSLEGTNLDIRGQQVGLEYNKAGSPRRVVLGSSERVDLRTDGKSGADFGPTLQGIFAPDLAEIVPSLPAYWRQVGEHFLQEELGPGEVAETQVRQSQPAQSKGSRNGVKAPVLLRGGDPTPTAAAKLKHYSATVKLHLWVEPSGLPSNLEVLQPAGLGLDEQALAAVALYRFQPAKKDGVPIPVELFVDVAF